VTDQDILQRTWETLAHKILASVLVDPGAVHPAHDVLGNSLHWWPKESAKVWQGVLQCMEAGALPTVEAVTARCGVDGYVQTIANQFDSEDNRKLVYHAGELRRLGGLFEFRRLGHEMWKADDADELDAMVAYAETRLGGLLAEINNRQGDAKSVSDSAWEQIRKFDGNGVPTGLHWFDEMTGGLWPGMNYWIVAPYKMGKSSMMRSCLLTALEAGHACDVFCAEGSREWFVVQCQGMIATRVLLEQGYEAPLRLSALFIFRAWRKQLAVFTKDELDALNEARRVWDNYNVRVWDTTDGIRNLVALRHRIRRSKHEHGSLVHWCDYSQLFNNDAGGSLYDRQSVTALKVGEIATSEKVAVCMLAQKNEASIRDSSGYSSGVKGGGDANAVADFEFIVSRDEQMPKIMLLRLKYSRWTSKGSGEHFIIPCCGLIADRWQRRLAL